MQEMQNKGVRPALVAALDGESNGPAGSAKQRRSWEFERVTLGFNQSGTIWDFIPERDSSA